VKPNPDVKPQNTEVNRAETEKARNHNEDNGQKGISSKDPKSEDLKKGDEYYSPEDKSRPYKSSQNFRERPNNKYGQDNRKYEGGDNKQYYNNQDKEKSGDIKYDEEDYGYEEDRGGNDKKRNYNQNYNQNYHQNYNQGYNSSYNNQQQRGGYYEKSNQQPVKKYYQPKQEQVVYVKKSDTSDKTE